MNQGSYDDCAALYDAAFADITVRALEWEFIVSELNRVSTQLGRLPSVLEIGCGNGQMLRQLLEAGVIASGTGLDASGEMIKKAKERHAEISDLHFDVIAGSGIPSPDHHYDVVISFLSFRYLDWEAIAAEIQRVGSAFLMIDMATTILTEEDHPLYEETQRRTKKLHAERPEFAQALQQLVSHPAWHEMLSHHPRIAASKYEEFLTTRFPHGDWSRLYVCGDHSLFTFRTAL